MIVLLVEDNPEFSAVVQIRLKGAGWDVWPADNIRQAADMLTRPGRPALVILDWVLPDIEGPRALEWLKRTLPGVPIIVLTAYGHDPTIKRQAIRGGASSFLSKSAPWPSILATIRQVTEENNDPCPLKILDDCVVLHRKAGQIATFTPVQVRLLQVLGGCFGEPVTYEVLVQRIYTCKNSVSYESQVARLRVDVHRANARLRRMGLRVVSVRKRQDYPGGYVLRYADKRAI